MRIRIPELIFWLTSIAVPFRTWDNSLTVTELQIHGEPFRARVGPRLAKERLDSRATSEERAPFRQRTGRSGVELSETKLTVRSMKRRFPQIRIPAQCGHVYPNSSYHAL